ncbi:phosphoribosylaminoimidazole-succinocarboxamide synthase [Desulfomarina profundi]|uniref:Phosphoribosylaminoimidazole-succinocarboxamide synthase n=1 Tax=Desulfomarina profundi TaxID=2772557 RepID=A0A8D5FVZ0_9BACT|nr:phosphoribosylaminoimidazolesuccinocarboxamide synthase [Desulfomarina profundi]BCL60917.1 phosphoribosylaminoimidazole-succinocarboxamide synthase [Desulfomarina profundi]
MVTVTTTRFPELELVHRGKVRDMYSIPGHGDKLLMVATDRISAYDVVMEDAIPGKGAVLTELSLFWFKLLGDIVDNHLISAVVDEYPEICHQYREQLQDRSMLVRRTRPLTIECIVRGYISGSFWKAYQKNTTVCGFELPTGMKESEKFSQPLFTPSTKAEIGDHDENISLDQMAEIVGEERARQIADISIALYERASEFAGTKGIIIADTKFELGEIDGKLILIDEVLTPDSSRFWPEDKYELGKPQPSFDKQFLRDYLSSLDWNKKAPAPPLPREIIEKTRVRYEEAVRKIVS